MKQVQKDAVYVAKTHVTDALASLRKARSYIGTQFDVSGMSLNMDDCTAAEIDRLIDGTIDQCMGVVSRIGRVR